MSRRLISNEETCYMEGRGQDGRSGSVATTPQWRFVCVIRLDSILHVVLSR